MDLASIFKKESAKSEDLTLWTKTTGRFKNVSMHFR